jgi:diaminopimelate decarboxylase/L-glutamyl-[BtrI acyl-carrier protein] decarboxylase
VVKVLYKKSSYGKTFLIVDGGFHQNMAATGYGQFPRRHFAIEPLCGAGREIETVSVAGKTCFQMDLLAEDLKMASCEPGDLLCVKNSGAYGLSFSPLHFLSHRPPRELWLD